MIDVPELWSPIRLMLELSAITTVLFLIVVAKPLALLPTVLGLSALPVRMA